MEEKHVCNVEKDMELIKEVVKDGILKHKIVC